MKKIIIPLAIIIILVTVIFTIKTQKLPKTPATQTPVQETPISIEKIKNLNLTSGTTISNTYTITGEASGLYFEGSFPIYVKDVNNQIITTLIAQSQGDWMTTDFVPFTTEFATNKIPNGSYALEFTQDDPSDGESGNPIYVYSLPIVIAN